MGKLQARTLRWKAVESDQVVGYKVYWSKGEKVTYDSESVYIQDLTEIVIPDALEGFVHEPGVYMFGITTLDQWGNESDMTTLREPFHFTVPPAPESLWVAPISVPVKPDPVWSETMDLMAAADSTKGQTEEDLLISELEDIIDDSETQPGSEEENQQPPAFYDH